MKVFSADFFDDLTAKAHKNPRKRQHLNIHEDYQDPCQRLFNALEPDTYIRPHRHFSDPKTELLIGVRGLMALVVFNEDGPVNRVLRFGINQSIERLAIGAEITPNTYHTVIALEYGSVLLEVKAGPFDPSKPKDPAPWAPEEGAVGSLSYLKQLKESLPYHFLKDY
jgi:cupin fold WbuC family metalloprotein